MQSAFIEGKGSILDKVFVYGTLKSGHGNNRLLEGCTLLGEFVTLQTFSMFNAGFPVTFYKQRGHAVLGEVYEIPEDQLKDTIRRLDMLESEGSMYSRETVRALPLSDSSPAIETYMYVGMPRFWNNLPSDRFHTPNSSGFLQWERELR